MKFEVDAELQTIRQNRFEVDAELQTIRQNSKEKAEEIVFLWINTSDNKRCNWLTFQT
jgi:hypothetical protein